LERELDELKLSDANHQRTHKDNRAKILEVEARLAEYEDKHQDHSRRHSTNRKSISNLEMEVERLNEAHGEKDRLHATNRTKLQELEEQLANAHASHGKKHTENELKLKELQEQHDLQHRRVAELELKEEQGGDLQKRVNMIQMQLESERRALSNAQDELADAKQTAEQIQKDAEQALTNADELMKARQREFEEKMRLKDDQIQSLEQQLDGNNKPRKRDTVRMSTTSKQSSRMSSTRSTLPGNRMSMSVGKARQSLWGELQPTREYLVGVLLPGSTDEFVQKVQAATRTVGEALKMANEAHVRCIDSQIKAAMQSLDDGGNLQDGMAQYAERLEIESERRAAADQVEAASHELKALREELAIQHDLKQQDKDEVAARIELDLSKCVDELELLRSASALGDVEENAVKMLVNLHNDEAGADWDDGFTPMHWAAKNGRRDIIEYLLRMNTGPKMLQSRDQYGRVPLYYAQKSDRLALSHWMKEEVGNSETAPVEMNGGRPASLSATLPEPYMKVLGNIEKHGWHSMNWRDGYTMLHWAASKGHVDVCKYLVQLSANPMALDGQRRTPIDIAVENRHEDLANILRGLKSPR
jgi:hypothetical protein